MTALPGNNLSTAGPPLPLAALPDLYLPEFKWDEADYASLEARLDLYSDFLLMTRFTAGQATDRFIVDPTDLAAALAGLNFNTGLLPENTLFWHRKDGQPGLGVYLPPHHRLVSIRAEARAWRIPLPGLVFAGRGYHYQIWAAPERPTRLDQPLYLAPLPNVSPEGVCLGNAPFPQAEPATIYQAVDTFFNSRFNHDLSNGKSRQFPDRIIDHWRVLHESQADTYPVEDLIGTNLTLGGLIHAL